MKRRSRVYNLIAAAVFAIIMVCSAPFTSWATDTTISATVGHDYCANIAGFQSSVPSGMVVDSNDNCYTPPPATVDMCNNISGTQASIPDGYYRDGSGDCYVQPSPPAEPIDVCPNISGVQASVPAGYINDANGNCVVAPVDRCSNIDGIQQTVPEGMTRDNNGVCSTPTAPTESGSSDSATTDNTTSTDASGSSNSSSSSSNSSSSTLKNTPSFLVPIIAPLVDIMPKSIKEAVRSLPPIVAQSFPYYVFAALGFSAVFMWFQAVQEAAAASRFIALLKRERSIAEQKDNFIALASHYLRTPLTVMSNGLDTLAALSEVPEPNITAVRTPVSTLGSNIESILADVQNNTASMTVQNVDEPPKEKSFLRSGYFWWPIIASIAITLFANFLLGTVGNVDLGTLNQIIQILVFIMVVFFFYSALRNHHTRKRNRAYQEQLVTNEHTIDKARNEFLARTTNTLQQDLSAISSGRMELGNTENTRFFDDGYNRLASILGKFTLLSQIQTGVAMQTANFDLRAEVDAAILQFSAEASAKNVSFSNNVPTLNINQNSQLLNFVIGTLIDNAIRFSSDNSVVEINAKPGEKKLSLSITNTGSSIPSDKQTQLFKPFSRTESAVEFNYEGMGFSLFLDKIIMEYLDGDIEVESQPDKGTTFTITASDQPTDDGSATNAIQASSAA